MYKRQSLRTIFPACCLNFGNSKNKQLRLQLALRKRDVYKRQLLAKPPVWRLAQVMSFTVPGGAGGAQQVEESLHSCALVIAVATVAACPTLVLLGMPTPEAVSYTHLDVYKRQQLPGICWRKEVIHRWDCRRGSLLRPNRHLFR